MAKASDGFHKILQPLILKWLQPPNLGNKYTFSKGTDETLFSKEKL